jgi:trans-2,3-dihydro-3-hydroxyanthranilate isomerase
VGRYRYVVCDVFTDVPLAGNQLAVFTDAREIPEPQLQKLAKEMRLPETVYVYPPENDGHVKVRIFTPGAELPFAGHPVHRLWRDAAAARSLGAVRPDD